MKNLSKTTDLGIVPEGKPSKKKDG